MNKVEEFFKHNNLPFTVRYLNESTATVDLAAAALGEKPERIAKTLSFQVKDDYIVVVFAGTARMDNKKYKQTFGVKAKMLSAEQALEYIGHPVGGVCPFALPGNVKVYLDQSLQQFDYIYPAAGTPNSAVKMSPQELYMATEGSWVEVSQDLEAKI